MLESLQVSVPASLSLFKIDVFINIKNATKPE